MSRVPSRVAGSPRVYYIVALAIALAVVPGTARGQTTELTVAPGMIRGAPTAPVTIVEFSDYQ